MFKDTVETNSPRTPIDIITDNKEFLKILMISTLTNWRTPLPLLIKAYKMADPTLSLLSRKATLGEVSSIHGSFPTIYPKSDKTKPKIKVFKSI